MLTLQIAEAPLELVPGQTIHVRAGWQRDEPPESARVTLFWYTQGRGTQDVGVVAEQDLDTSLLSQEEQFEFTIPPSPYSFSGTLIALKWAVELIIDRGDEVERLELMVSPWVEQVRLKAVEDAT